MIIIAHRWQEYKQSGAEMVEVDLRKKDGQIVLSHDRPRKSQQLVNLQELLLAAKVPLNLELKEAGFEAEVLKAIKNFSFKVLISSKHPSILKKIRALDENVQLGLILGRANFFLLPLVPKLDKKLNLYSVHPKTFLVSSKLVKKLHDLGKKVFVWTVHDRKKFERFRKIGVDGIFTDL